jgi:hypothetical protein
MRCDQTFFNLLAHVEEVIKSFSPLMLLITLMPSNR